MGNMIVNIGGPSIGLPGLGGINFGSGGGLFGGAGFGGGLFGSQGLFGGLGNIPGLEGTLFKLGIDAMTGNLPGVLRGIGELGSLLSNFAGGNVSPFQPLPSSFSPTGSPTGSNSAPSGQSSCRCGGDEESDDQRIDELLRQLLQAFGPMLQAFSQLLSLMLNRNGDMGLLQSGLNNSRFSISI